MLDVEDLIAFSQAHPAENHWPAEMVRRFLTQLVSSEILVCDLRENGERVAVAALLDRVSNPGRNATLELLGRRPEGDQAAVYDRILAFAKERLPAWCDGIEVTIPDTLAERDALAARHGLVPYYETYGMLNEAPGEIGPPPAGLCTIVTDRDEAELYAVLRECFAGNVDTSIPDFADWQAARRAPSRSKTWGIWTDKRLVAFLNLVVPRDIAFAEIRTIGTLPEHRGRGHAQALIRRAMQYVSQLEIPRCALTVAVRNQRALELYRRLGFREVEHQSVYRWVAKSSSSKAY